MAKGKYKNKNKPSEQIESGQSSLEQEQPLSKPTQDTILSDMTRLDFENQMVHEQMGKEAPTYGFWGWLYRMQQKYGHTQLHKVNKKKYIWLALLTGWMGGHRFYEKRYKVAMLYLLFCWTFVPLTMIVIDIMIVIPKEPDEQGMIEL